MNLHDDVKINKKIEKSAYLHDFLGSREAFVETSIKNKKDQSGVESHVHSSHKNTPEVSPRRIHFQGRTISTKR